MPSFYDRLWWFFQGNWRYAFGKFKIQKAYPGWLVAGRKFRTTVKSDLDFLRSVAVSWLKNGTLLKRLVLSSPVSEGGVLELASLDKDIVVRLTKVSKKTWLVERLLPDNEHLSLERYGIDTLVLEEQDPF